MSNNNLQTYDEVMENLKIGNPVLINETRSSKLWHLQKDNQVCKQVFPSEIHGSKINPIKENLIVSKLNHKHIVEFIQFQRSVTNDSQKVFFITMPKYDEDLTQEILDNVNDYSPQYSFEHVSKLAYQILQAMAYAASQNIVHNDLCPDNIMVYKGDAKVIDFGLAQDFTVFPYKTLNEQQEFWARNIEFAGPEVVQLLNNQTEKFVDEFKNDVFMYGATIFLLIFKFSIQQLKECNLSWKPYFKKNSENIKYKAVDKKLYKIFNHYQYPKEQFKSLLNLLKQCLQKDPNDRATFSELLNHEFFMQFQKQEPLKNTDIINNGNGNGNDNANNNNTDNTESTENNKHNTNNNNKAN